MQQKSSQQQEQHLVIPDIIENAQQEVSAARTPWYLLVRRSHILFIVYAFLLVLFGLLALFVHFFPVTGIDVAITREFQENHTPWLRTLMIAVSYQGNSLLLEVGLLVLAGMILWGVRLRLEALMLLGVYSSSAVLNNVLKVLVGRPRPTQSLVEVLQVAPGRSFPSGHVMSYVAFWGFLFLFSLILFKGMRWWRISLLVISAFFLLLVGPSRIYLGDHWASDVLGAYLIGGIWLGLAMWLYFMLKGKGVLATREVLKP